MLRWYLVHTKPSGEASAELNLTRQGYRVYFPRVVQAMCSETPVRVPPEFALPSMAM
jgi:hypothetical protein